MLAVVDDTSLGIHRYEFRGVWNKTEAIVVVHLRPVCIGRMLTARGVMGVISATPAADKGGHYTAPEPLVEYQWQVKLYDPLEHTTTRMHLFQAVDREDHTVSFVTLEAELAMPDALELRVDGSPWRHELFLPDCAMSATAADHPLQRLPGSLFNDKHWVAVVLPRMPELPMQQYSSLLSSHNDYHRQLGFAGTIVLCGPASGRGPLAATGSGGRIRGGPAADLALGELHCTVTALSLHCHCTVTALSLHCHCTVTALSLHCHCTVTALSPRQSSPALPQWLMALSWQQ